MACHNLPSALVAWPNCDKEIDYQRRDVLEEENLPGEIRCLNCMLQELCGVSNLIHVVDRIDVIFRYRGFWTVKKMRRLGPVAVSVLEQTIGWLRIKHPSSRTRLVCFFDGTNFKAFQELFDFGTKGTNVPQYEPKT